jgi:hypothetical protein
VNLHGIVSGAIGAVNPNVSATMQRSTGYATQPDGTQTPNYETYANVVCQFQELTQRDLRKLDGVNLQGVTRALYLNGSWSGVVRADARGGDLVITPDNATWLVTAVIEQWPDWCKLLVTKQNGGG